MITTNNNRWSWISPLILVLPIGCTLAEAPDLGRPPLEVLPLAVGTEPGAEDVQMSRNVLLVADNQFRYTGGEGIVMTSALVDVFVPTAARPIALNLFSDDVYRWCIDHADGRPVLHMGDVCDISCVLEFGWFAEIMRDHGGPWAMVPGNHDCMFMGSMMEMEWQDGDWARACEGGGGPMDKADFVALYLGAIWDQLRDGPDGESFAMALGMSTDELARNLPEPGLISERYPTLADRIRNSAPRGSWSSDDPQAFLTGISWNIDEDNTWRSFIAQRVSLTDPAYEGAPEEGGFTGILLDTCQWWHQPQLIPFNVVPPYEWNPGLSGELLADQLIEVEQWMIEANEEDDAVALFAHHPVKEFTPKSRRALDFLWENYTVLALTSGHTHAGYLEIHKDIDPTALEINVASITDWPMEWRDLQLSRYRRGDQPYYGIESPRHTVLEELVTEGVDIRENWDSYEEGAQHFLSYRVTEDMALDYDTGVGDLLTGGQWFLVSTVGLLTYIVIGEETLARQLYDQVIPNIDGAEREHLARERLEMAQLLDVWDRFPTIGHGSDPGWAATEAEVRRLCEPAMKRDSTKEDLDAASWPMVAFELQRQVADPDAMRRYRVMLSVWASMYESNRDRDTEVQDQSFRMAREKAPESN